MDLVSLRFLCKCYYDSTSSLFYVILSKCGDIQFVTPYESLKMLSCTANRLLSLYESICGSAAQYLCDMHKCKLFGYVHELA